MELPNLRPTDTMLKQFGVLGSVVLGIAVAPWMLYRGQVTTATVVGLAAIVLLVLALVRARWIKWIFIAASLLSWPIGWAISYVALAVIYYLVFTPVALVFRGIGRDALDRKLDRRASSYWKPHNPDRGPDSYFRQF